VEEGEEEEEEEAAAAAAPASTDCGDQKLDGVVRARPAPL
jgi:hypothetical protein